MFEPEHILTVREVRSLILRADPPTLSELSYALDRVVSAYWSCPKGQPDERDLELTHDYKSLYALLGPRFPDLGFYASVDSTEGIDADVTLADGIDDLCDIVLELDEVLLRFSELGQGDANWYLRFCFEHHLGQHVRELSKHLYELIRAQASA